MLTVPPLQFLFLVHLEHYEFEIETESSEFCFNTIVLKRAQYFK